MDVRGKDKGKMYTWRNYEHVIKIILQLMMMYEYMVARQMHGTGCLLGNELLLVGQYILCLCFRLFDEAFKLYRLYSVELWNDLFREELE
jgi:hypothetical protein